MKRNRCLFAVGIVTAISLCLSGSDSLGKDKNPWVRVAELTAGGEAKEVQVHATARQCRIQCVEGSVAIKTLVVREGADKATITVASKIEAGEQKDIELEREMEITGFRVSDGGQGRYEIYVANKPAPKRSEKEAGEWQTVGVFDVNEEAREIQFSGQATQCRLEWVDGQFAIKTVVVRVGGDKKIFTIATHFEKGVNRDIDLGADTAITGFRLSHGGRGRYRLLVK